jgi:hypothetical protein
MFQLACSRNGCRAALFPLVVWLLAAPQCDCGPAPSDPLERIESLLQKLSSAPPDTCGVPPTASLDVDDVELSMASLDVDDVELSILKEASDAALRALNAADPEPNASRDRAAAVLEKIEQSSAQLNASWPKESRFHFQILDNTPALVLKAGIGTHERYFVFGIPEMNGSGKANRLWQQVGEDSLEIEGRAARDWIELYPLHRGPSRRARFLAAVGYTGCAGSSGVLYDAQEWNPDGLGELDQVIKQSGAFGMDEAANGGKPTRRDPFAAIGKLQTQGSLIALPYCWFSAIDTWDNPSLCALDIYDLSGDSVRFRSRAYNRPDLLPIAKAIEYAEKHDLPAVRGYCVSEEVASRLVREIGPSYFASDLSVTQKPDGSERVEMGFPGTDRFEIQKIGSRWLVARFNRISD